MFVVLICVIFTTSIRANEIDLVIPTSQFLLVLKYIGSSVFCCMRLTKRPSDGIAVLRFEFQFNDSNYLVVHDVPVEILLQNSANWTEPALPEPTSKSLFPSRKVLATYAEKFSNMGLTEVYLEMVNGDCKLSGLCQAVKVAIRIPTNSDALAAVSISLKGLLFALSRIGDSGKCIICVCNDKYLSIWSQLPNDIGVVAAVTPAILTD